MTQQVRKGYRNHRKASWALVIALAALIAAVVIPIASGASDKNYTLSLTPATVCSSTDEGGASTLVTLGNTAKSASLGSAEIYFPAGTVSTSTSFKPTFSPAPAGSTIALRPSSTTRYGIKDVVAVSNLNLAKTNSLGMVVRFKANATFASPSTDPKAVVKQSNNFNDTSGTANLFEDPLPWPSFTVQTCAKIEGNVYQDTNGDGAKNGSETAFLAARTVTLSNGASTQTDTNGNYTFYVATGGTYTVCTTTASNEAQTQPTGNTAPVGSQYCGTSPDVAGYRLTPNANVASVDFGIAGGVVGACDVGLTAPTTGGATYGATLGGSNCSTKVSGQKLVFNTYTDTSGQFATLRPTSYSGPACNVGLNTNCVTVLEQLTWKLAAGSTPKPLKYDDTFPYTFDDNTEVMPYCKVDPTDSSGPFTPAQVLPQRPNSSYHTSCFFDSIQKLKKTGGVWFVERIDKVYSAQDGGRGVF